ncbi:MAG TPA: heavy-metal-associated domain-containing protein, partial [Novosphingobium sp.]|nr:heavy-metal-associated domain-containing protein [Novosphingobium sp.]
RGQLRPDPTLSLEHPQIDPGLARLIAMGRAAEAQAAAAAAQAAAAFDPLTGAAVPSAPPPEARPEARPSAAAVGVVLQFPTPDARSVDGALAAVRAIGGVQSASIASIALGGSSVMRVNYGGNPADFAAALKAHGWQVSGSGAALRIRR